MSDRSTLSTVRNAARVLKAFSSKRRSFGVTELARELDLSTSTAHRLLRTLAEEHLLEQDATTGRYRLGLAIYDLMAATTEFDLTHAVLPPMTVLRHRTGETVQCGVLDGREVVYVERLESPRTLRLFIEVGRRNWAHSTGSGKTLLAFLEPSALDKLLSGWQLEPVTDTTIVDHDALRAELETVRRDGYAVNRGESEPGVMSVGAPVRDRQGRPVASLSVAGPSDRMTTDFDMIVHSVVEAAAIASRRLVAGGAGEGAAA